MLNQFRNYLIETGHKEFSASGSRSTSWDYPYRISKLIEREGITLDTLSSNISKYLELYGRTGEKWNIGRKSHESVINSLRQFEKFISSVQKPGTLSIFRFGSSKY